MEKLINGVEQELDLQKKVLKRLAARYAKKGDTRHCAMLHLVAENLEKCGKQLQEILSEVTVREEKGERLEYCPEHKRKTIHINRVCQE